MRTAFGLWESRPARAVPLETINLKSFDKSQRVSGVPIMSYNLTD